VSVRSGGLRVREPGRVLKSEFSGILHRYITMDDSAKVALWVLLERTSVFSQLHRGLAPPVMPPSITSSALVMWLDASDARKSTPLAMSCA
jgi:hypothetical protein